MFVQIIYYIYTGICLQAGATTLLYKHNNHRQLKRDPFAP